MVMVRTWIEPVVAGVQVGSSFYDTGLLMVVKNNYNHTNSSSNSSSEDALQKAISNFYIIYNLIMGLTPLLSAYILANIGDKKNRKIPICVPLGGYLISRLVLLFVILLDWPIEVMYGSAALNGLTGWFTTYWAGVMVWASLGCSEKRRSLQLIIVELVYGLAGFIGSLVSGHIFIPSKITHHPGAVLVSFSIGCYAFCLLYSIFVLKISNSEETCTSPSKDEHKAIRENLHEPINSEYTEHSRLLGDKPDGSSAVNTYDVHTTIPSSNVIIIILFASAVLYNVASNAAEDVITVYVLKKPLSWGPVDIGYGNAAGYMIYITSLLGVYVFSKCCGDLSMIIIGMVSFCAGILIMAFVRWTFLYYIARAVMMFSFIPTPAIRSVISKHIHGSSYGKVFVVLQLAIDILSVSFSAGFNKVYQATLDWFSGFCFILCCIIGLLSIIPVSNTGLRRNLWLKQRFGEQKKTEI
ncbi:solute carrier family 46 member 2-like isoform X3 [Ascaphus truei]|uniref:solute carrier family 46 member 2-like isoform X3 n=1 Tax=Ascaphus truei TaxID=8439 RepID=UPI003F5AC288